jgi:hypothetical protein
VCSCVWREGSVPGVWSLCEVACMSMQALHKLTLSICTPLPNPCPTPNLCQVPTVGQNWTVDPFSGLLRDGFVWGRGSIDDKQAVVSILEAVEHLLASGFAPKRSLFIVFGHDEVRSG